MLVGEGLRRTPDRPDPYVVQAAIAACHALAPTWADTDWAAVLSWYDVLLTVADTPVARLNRAVAVGELSGPSAGIAAVDAVADLRGYPLWHAARAELLARIDRLAEAETPTPPRSRSRRTTPSSRIFGGGCARLDPEADPTRTG